MPSATRSPASTVLPETTTLAPSLANSSADPFPMPAVDPVTMATFPASLMCFSWSEGPLTIQYHSPVIVFRTTDRTVLTRRLIGYCMAGTFLAGPPGSPASSYRFACSLLKPLHHNRQEHTKENHIPRHCDPDHASHPSYHTRSGTHYEGQQYEYARMGLHLTHIVSNPSPAGY